MDKDTSYWATLTSHASTPISNPPWGVILAAAALVRDDEIKGSWATYKPGTPNGPTIWTASIVTAERLIYAELEFDAERYDLQAHNAQLGVTSRIVAAWARRLRDITCIEIGQCETSTPPSGPLPWFAVGDITLGFSDGAQVDLRLDQRGLTRDHDEDRRRSDGFLDAIRTGAGL